MAAISPSKREGSSKGNFPNAHRASPPNASPNASRPKSKNKESKERELHLSAKRRCVSTACIACRRRKSKCDGNTPSCAACSSVYGTQCVYDPSSDHRRKGVYKKDIDSLKTRNSTLQTLIQAILNYPDDEVADLVRQIRTCESLDDVAEGILSRDNAPDDVEDDEPSPLRDESSPDAPRFETELSGKMGELRLDDGSVRHIGGTSNLIYLGSGQGRLHQDLEVSDGDDILEQHGDPITSWTNVASDHRLISHLMTMYFTWHYTYFTTLSKELFYRDFLLGKRSGESRRKTVYCTSLLVNAMLALGCHFTSAPGSRSDPDDSATAGDHFFREAKRLILENDEHEKPRLPTVQALALMSVREAGCGREAKGWIYSGMSFRMAFDLGLNLNLTYNHEADVDDQENDARKITFWGCFLFDKCWSNYLGRQPQLPGDSNMVPKIEVFPSEEAAMWSPFTDSGTSELHSQPSRTRAVALQISHLCEISSDLLIFFYHPTHARNHVGKVAELKKLSELHTRLEAWKKSLPRELEAREGALPSVLLMHMFSQLLFIHLYRPFLKYHQATSPLPAHVSPRKLCTQAASSVSKLLRLYKRTYGLRQICNIAVYIAHSACTIHLLNLPDKNAKRDIIHGVKHLEEIAESWLCARRTLGILSVLTRRWNIDLPEEASTVLDRTNAKFGGFAADDVGSPRGSSSTSGTPAHSPGDRDASQTSPVETIGRQTNGIDPPSIKSRHHPARDNMSGAVDFQGSYPQALPVAGVPSIPQPAAYPQAGSESLAGSHTSPSMLSDGSEGVAQATGQHWWVNDQVSLMSGFNNWTMDASMMNPTADENLPPTNPFAFDSNNYEWYPQ